MKYLKIKDDVYIWKKGRTIVQNELLTMRECQRFGIQEYQFNRIGKIIEISKNKTFVMFGVRFIGHDYR